MSSGDRVGILIIHTGSPSAPTRAAVRKYLRELLDNPRVMDVPAPLRWVLLHAVILPFRSSRSARAYGCIWTEQGSPLLAICESVRAGIQERLPDAHVALGMCCGKPSIAESLDDLIAKGVAHVIVAPLFAQYASATTGVALERVYVAAASRWNAPTLSVFPPFYDEAWFLDALAAAARPTLESFRPDHVLMSFHGLPERHIQKSDPTSSHCLVKPDCCDVIGPHNRYCYRAQCLATARGLAQRLSLGEGAFTVAFQSRLGRGRWLSPHTHETIEALAQQGIKRLGVICPSFTVDCLETLEEIGLRGKAAFLGKSGEAFQLIPCLNDHPAWLDALADELHRL